MSYLCCEDRQRRGSAPCSVMLTCKLSVVRQIEAMNVLSSQKPWKGINSIKSFLVSEKSFFFKHMFQSSPFIWEWGVHFWVAAQTTKNNFILYLHLYAIYCLSKHFFIQIKTEDNIMNLKWRKSNLVTVILFSDLSIYESHIIIYPGHNQYSADICHNPSDSIIFYSYFALMLTYVGACLLHTLYQMST